MANGWQLPRPQTSTPYPFKVVRCDGRCSNSKEWTGSIKDDRLPQFVASNQCLRSIALSVSRVSASPVWNFSHTRNACFVVCFPYPNVSSDWLDIWASVLGLIQGQTVIRVVPTSVVFGSIYVNAIVAFCRFVTMMVSPFICQEESSHASE